jgi:hypothetical protein
MNTDDDERRLVRGKELILEMWAKHSANGSAPSLPGAGLILAWE